jgi:hypothetical protein
LKSFLQGFRAPGILTVPPGDEHERLRKEFTVFFNTDNINAVISELTAEATSVCSDVLHAASLASDGLTSADVSDYANAIINNVVRKVRCFHHCLL